LRLTGFDVESASSALYSFIGDAEVIQSLSYVSEQYLFIDAPRPFALDAYFSAEPDDNRIKGRFKLSLLELHS
jgi:hypothetical protein